MAMQNSDWEALINSVRQITEIHALEPLLTHTTHQALALSGAQQGHLVLLNDDGTYDFRVQVNQSGEPAHNPPTHIDYAILHHVIDSAEPLILAGAQADDHVQHVSGKHLPPVMCFPLVARGELLGALYLEHEPAAGMFADPVQQVMRAYADQAAIAIQNVMLNAELEDRATAHAKQLEETTQRLHVLTTAIDQSANAVVIANRDGTIDYINDAMCTLVDVAAEDVLGQPADVLQHQLVSPTTLQHIRAALQQGNEWRSQTCLNQHDRSPRWTELRVLPIADANGTTAHVVASIEDITARKQAEAALREREERLELAIAGGEHGLWDWNLETGMTVRNARWAEMLGYAPEDIEPHNLAWQRLCHPEDRERVQQAYTAHLAGESPFFDAEYRMRAKDGAWLWIHDRGRVVAWDADGNPLRMAGTQHDITRRKATELALQQAHDRLAVLQQVDFELTRELSVDYVVRIALNAAVQLSGADTGMIGVAKDNTVELVHALGAYTQHVGAPLPMHDGITARVLRDHVPVLVQDVSADPDYFPAVAQSEAQMTLPLMSGDRFVGVLSLETRDCTQFDTATFSFVKLLASRIAAALDNAQAYEELEHLVGELDAFANTVAHDLKNPLSLITGYISLLLDSDPEDLGDELFRESVGRIYNNSVKMAGIIDALLLLAGVRKEQDVQITPLDMKPIVREACEQLNHLIADTSATITLPDDWPLAQGYLPWVEQVWINYISNALKYGGRPPEITLGAEHADGDAVRFWVQDNGPGLTPEQQEQVFTPFTRLSDRKVEGHGLGLSIAQRIVTKLGGTVGVTNAPGGGCEFSFTLPRMQDL